MKTKLKVLLPILLALAVFAVAGWYLHHTSTPILQPRGIVGQKERGLLAFTLLLGMAVIIPVFVMAIAIAYRYREDNPKKAAYTPDWNSHRVAETIWWGIPIAIIGVLGVVTWRTTYQLDPYKALASSKKPLTVQVVSLDWKWLFIYPEQGVASVNLAPIPVGTSVDFEITSDTVMNSFWVPQLGGQIYAMPGMITHIHMMANQPGDYAGSSANISGSGFAGMKFTVRGVSDSGFGAWMTSARHSQQTLDAAAYARLAKPSKTNPSALYGHVSHELYDTIVMKYMMPMSGDTNIDNHGIAI